MILETTYWNKTCWLLCRGEGEYALVDIPKQNTGDGINNDNYVQIEDLNKPISQIMMML